MTTSVQARQVRQDIQGLRFVAVLLVVVYHVWLDRVSGGVDIFLALSAFFLTRSFARKLEQGRPLALFGYWTRTFARIVPLATLTIIAVVITSPWLMPVTVWSDIAQQAIASALYYQNWWLAANDVNYYGGAPIPLQHFWSLSIQGSVFLAWPLVFAAVAGVVRLRPSWRPRVLLAITFGLIFVVSLAWSIWITATDQAFAYFDTRARLWEFAFGSLLALATMGGAAAAGPGSRLRAAVGWAGLAGILSVGVLINVRDAFPGWIALLPLTAAAAVVVVGDDPGRGRVGRLLGHRWVAGLGDASYALYLVHWPILIAYVVSIDDDQPSLPAGGAIIAVSLVLAWLLHRFVEQPLRALTSDWRPWRDATLVAACVVLVVGSAAGAQQFVRNRPDPVATRAPTAQHPGARVLLPGFRAEGEITEPSIPTLAELPHQWALAGDPCPTSWGLPTRAQQQCHVLTSPGASESPSGTEDDLPLQVPEGTTRVLMVGNSHVQHWATAIRRMAAERRWQVVLIYEQNCYLQPTGDDSNPAKKCVGYWDDVFPAIDMLDPTLLLALGTHSEYDGETVLKAGLDELFTHSKDGRTIVVMRDTPRFEVGLVQCDAARNPGDPPCQATHPVLDTPNPLTELVGKAGDGMTTLDLGSLVCPDALGVPAIGNVKVWMDQHHLTRAYIETTTELVETRLMTAIERA